MTSIVELASKLIERTEWQEVPRELSPLEYCNLIVYGIEQLFILTSRPETYSSSKVIKDDRGLPTYYNDVFSISEQEYIQLSSQILFFKKVQALVNSRVGYTTNAFSVTHADKPYTHLADTVEGLEKNRRILHYKLPYAI